MSAVLRFDDTDGTTVITVASHGNVPTPGTSANKKVFIENFGDQTAQNTTISLEQVGTNDGFTYEQMALDVSGSPGTFGSTDLSLGNIAVATKVAFWVRANLVSGLTSDNNARRLNVVATAQTI